MSVLVNLNLVSLNLEFPLKASLCYRNLMKMLVKYLVIQRAFLLKSLGPNQCETGERRESGYVCLGRPGVW